MYNVVNLMFLSMNKLIDAGLYFITIFHTFLLHFQKLLVTNCTSGSRAQILYVNKVFVLFNIETRVSARKTASFWEHWCASAKIHYEPVT